MKQLDRKVNNHNIKAVCEEVQQENKRSTKFASLKYVKLIVSRDLVILSNLWERLRNSYLREGKRHMAPSEQTTGFNLVKS